jgi:4-aminobutyrate aminotransferase-like enzyme
MDAPLAAAVMTCTGSEANDLALRMAQAITGKTGIIVTDHTYHGNTIAVSQLSRTSPPVGGASDHVRFLPAPDSYRPKGNFAETVAEKIAELQKTRHGFSALLICPFFANEGFPELPPGWLDETVKAVRSAGGLIIADEIQPGFGRLGSHMWGHQHMSFTPDIVTLGKPMGNGHPVGATVTSYEHMATFRKASKYFNTFGGNPVSCAAAMATLQVLQDENLMQNAAQVGAYAKAGLQRLAAKHQAIGDIRGAGFFFGAEFVLDRATKTPTTQFTKKVVNEMRRRGVLLNFIGINYNTLKLRPPMPFSRANADLMLETLDDVLRATPLAA